MAKGKGKKKGLKKGLKAVAKYNSINQGGPALNFEEMTVTDMIAFQTATVDPQKSRADAEIANINAQIKAANEQDYRGGGLNNNESHLKIIAKLKGLKFTAESELAHYEGAQKDLKEIIELRRAQDRVNCEDNWNARSHGDFINNNPNHPDSLKAKAASIRKCAEGLENGKLARSSLKTTSKNTRRGKRSAAAAAGNLYQLEQAYLLQNIESFLNKDGIGNAPVPANLERIIVARGPGNLANTLSIGNSTNTLMSLTPAQVSSLSPYIRIFKGTIGGSFKEFKFSSKSPDITTYLKDGTGAHKNIGLISFDITATGTNQFMAPKSFMANMKISFSSVSDLDTGNVFGGELTYLDLLYGGDAAPESARSTLFVEMGYKASSNSFNNLAQDKRLAIQDSLNANRKLFILTPTQNEKFEFNEDGTIELLIEYHASAEYLANNDSSNILEIGVDIAARELKTRLELELDTKRKKKEKRTDAERKYIAGLEKRIKENNKSNKLSNYRRFVKHLVDNDRLFSFFVSDEYYLRDIIPANVRHAHPVTAEQAAAEVTKGTPSPRTSNLALTAPPKDHRTIAYFYLGDLINYMATALELPAGSGPTTMLAEVIMGDYEFEIEDYAVDNEITALLKESEGLLNGFEVLELLKKTRRLRINLSELPVSFDMYNLFMYEQVMKTGRDKYTFAAFLKDAVSKLLSACVSEKVNHRREKVTGIKSGRTDAGKPPLMQILAGESSVLMDAKGTAAVQVVPGGEATINPVSFSLLDESIRDPLVGGPYRSSSMPRSFITIYGSMINYNLKGIESSEEVGAAEGIYHMSPGRDRGIVKSVKFEASEAPDRDLRYVKAYQNETLDSDLGVRKRYYDATVMIYGPPIFGPGAYLYITPPLTGVGSIVARRSIASKLSLGGFYMVLEASTSLSLGELSTTMKCGFRAFPDPEPAVTLLEREEIDAAPVDAASTESTSTESTSAVLISRFPRPSSGDLISHDAAPPTGNPSGLITDNTDKNNSNYPRRGN
jgi:hypothetical protein